MHSTPEPLAIVGMSTRLPDADSVDDFWNLLLKGVDTCKHVPNDVFNMDTYYDPTGAARNRMGARTGNWFNRTARRFDPSFFGYTKDEVLNMDPQHRLSLLVSYEALEDAGWTPSATTGTTADRTGVFVAATSDDYTQHLMSDIQPTFHSGKAREYLAQRISSFFGFNGVASATVDTACNGSLVALDVACNKIRNRTCSAALVGGVSIISQPQVSVGLDKAHFLSRTGQCKTLDAGADGYSRSDAVSFIYIKKLSDAIRDKDHVCAELLACVTNHSGEAHSITHPHAPAQKDLLTAILDQSGVPVNSVNVIEGHGTGTQAGDWNELSAINEVFIQGTGRDIENKLVFTASKSNIGHSEAASGLSGIIKMCLMFKHGLVPPHVGIRSEMNPRLKPIFDTGHLALARDGPMMLPRGKGRITTAIVSNFGASGSNTSCVIRSPSSPAPSAHPTRRLEHLPVIISARSKAALQRNVDAIVKAIDEDPKVDLADLSYTLTARRIHHEHKVAHVATSVAELRTQLADSASASAAQPDVPNAVSISTLYEVATDMAKRLPSFRRHIARYDTVALLFGLSSFGQSLQGTQLHRSEAEFAFCYAVSAMVTDWLVKAPSKPSTVQTRYSPALLQGIEDLAASKLGGSDAARRGAAAGAGSHNGELIDPLALLGETSWTYGLAKALTDAALVGSPLHWRVIMDELTPDARLVRLPLYSWDLEEIYVEYTDLALVTPSWSDNPVRIGTSKKAKTAPASKKPKEPEAIRISDVVKLLASNVYEINVIANKGVLGSVIQAIVDILVGDHFDITSLDLGNIPSTATKLRASLETTPASKIFEFSASAGKGAEARGIACVRSGPAPPNHVAQMFLPIAEQQHRQLLKKGAASFIPSELFYRMLAATEPVVIKCVSNIRVSRDGSAAVVSLKPGAAHRLHIAHAIAQSVAWMSNMDKQSAGSSPLTFQAYQSQDLDLRPNTMMEELKIVILAKHAAPNEWAGQACVIHADGSHMVGIVDKCLCAAGRSAPAAIRHSSPTTASAPGKVRSPVAPSAKASVSTLGRTSDSATTSSAELSDVSTRPSSSADSTPPSSIADDDDDFSEVEEEYEEEVEVEQAASSGGGGGGPAAFLQLVVETIADETGTSPDDIRNSAFADIGIDSLMSLALLDRLREGTSVEIPGSLFIDCATMQDLEEWAREHIKCGEEGPAAASAAGAKTTKMVKKVRKVKVRSSKPKARPVDSSSSSSADVSPPPEPVAQTASPAAEPAEGAMTVSAFLKLVTDIISDETGTSPAEIMNSAFADIGIDSLMSLALLDRLREAAGMDIPGSLFIDCATMQDLEEFAKQHLPESAAPAGASAGAPSKTASAGEETASTDSSVPGKDGKSLLADLDRPMKLDFPKITEPTAPAVLLCGRKSAPSGARPLFLVPDGSGSAAVFQNMPSIGRVAYGLNSPFLKAKKCWEGGVPELAHHYIAQIRAKQPHGPYLIGGWSYGGVVCYEIVLQLALQGERVDALLLLDSPCPRTMPPLPTAILDWSEKSNALDGMGIKGFTEQLANHFKWAIGTLATYDPPKLPASLAPLPKTFLFTALEGVRADAAEVEGTNETVRWMFTDRAGLGPHGWEVLVGGAEQIEVYEFAGNHFSMMDRKYAPGWAEGIVKFLKKVGV